MAMATANGNITGRLGRCSRSEEYFKNNVPRHSAQSRIGSARAQMVGGDGDPVSNPGGLVH
jgi:hypothetical protein